ncbi:MAG: DNA translocase FtsK 4TM domain-containing protein [Thiotrichaceae bacterium]|nr:DNA translocase FtsK 4TM domain-containing protein [Thiotrichaceae bacterium]
MNVAKAAKVKIKLNKFKRVSLQQTSILIFSGIAAIVFLSLITYSADDCHFFRISVPPCDTSDYQNGAGPIGVYISTLLYSFFGYISYLVPVLLLVTGWLMFRFPYKKNPNNPRGGINSWLSLLGIFLALFAGTGLAALLWPSAELPYSGGGFLGLIMAKGFGSKVGEMGAIFLFVSLFFAGLTLFADIKWALVLDKIGDTIMNFMEKLVGFDEPKTVSAGTVQQELPAKEETFFTRTSATITGSGAWLWLKDKKIQLLKYMEVEEESVDNKSSLKTPSQKTSSPKRPLATPPVTATSKSKKVITEPLPDLKELVEGPSTAVVDYSATNKVSLTTPDALTTPSKRSEPRVPLNKRIQLPELNLLAPPSDREDHDPIRLEMLATNIVEALRHFGVKDVVVDSWHPGPVITRFELQLNASTKVSKVTGLSKDLARNLGVHSVRIVEVIPGKTTIGLEVPNTTRDMVTMGSIVESDVFKNSTSALTVALGKDIAGLPVVADLAKMPHLLVAGTTGSGKSVAVNAMIISFLYKATADEVKMIMIDPKMLELSIYDDIPHLLTPVVTDMKDAAAALRWCVCEMERRYLVMSKVKVRNLEGYNAKVKKALDEGDPIIDPLYDATKNLNVTPQALQPMPQIVIVVDEFADMMMIVGKKVEELIARLAQKARAAGIHLILATQRPSVDVITGLIKANIPTRISFNVSTKVDSRTILDQGGAEQLLGQGDMLYLPPGSGMPQRIHGAYVSDDEVEEVVAYVKTQGEPDYISAVVQEAPENSTVPGLEPLAKESERDPLYDQAVYIITESRRASISYLQRRLKVGYNRAATMIEDMEQAGVVSAVQSNGTREVLAPEPIKD